MKESYSANTLIFSPLIIARETGFLSEKLIIDKTHTFQNYKKSSEENIISINILNLFNFTFENTSQYYKYTYKTIYDMFEKMIIIIQLKFYMLKTINYIFNLFISNIYIQSIIFQKKYSS